MVSASHREGRGEGGFSLVELLMAMLVLGVVMAMVGPVYSAIQRSEQVTQSVNVADDQVRPVLLELAAEVNSASVLYDPATEGSNAGSSIPAGFSLRMLTEAYGRLACVQWRVVDVSASGGLLEERSWSPGWQQGDAVPPWDVEAAGIDNPPSSPPFALSAATTYDADVLDVHLEVGTSSAGASSSPKPVLDMSTSVVADNAAGNVAGDNSAGGQASCSVVPPAGATP